MIRHGILESSRSKAAAPSYPTDGLLARYIFDDNLEDSYGSYDASEDGTSGSYSSTAVIGSKSYRFSGDGALSLPSGLFYLFESHSQPFSINYWWRIPSNGDANTARQMYVAQGTRTLNIGGAWHRLYPGTNAYAYLKEPTNSAAGWDWASHLNEWHMISLCFQGTGHGCKIYGWVDADSDSYGEAAVGSTTPSGVSFWRFGYMWQMWGQNGYCGEGCLIDGVYVYEKALSIDEASQLYNGGSGV